MLIFDIGANVGNYSLTHKDSNIISVEANPITFQKLSNNVKNYNNIIPLNYAISSSNSEFVDFYTCSADTLCTMDVNWISSPESRFGNYKNTINKISVKTISIDKMIEIYGTPDLIKVDVEGAEFNVISSLSKKTPILCFEWASEWKNDTINCIYKLNELGFTQYHIQIEDKYSYFPLSFNMNDIQVIQYINNTTAKIDWGMIWAK
jgi:FkbM family methyltransferase